MISMYLKGSKWSMNRRRRRVNPFTIIFLLVLIAAFIYLNKVVVPTIPEMFAPTPTPTRAPASLVTDAEALEAEGKYALAITAYEEAVTSDPRNPANYVALARLNIFNGNYQQAVTSAENALLLNPENDQALALRGLAIGLTGDYIRAIGSLQEAITIDPENAAAHAYLAEVLIYQIEANQGDLNTLDNAIAESKLALTLAPDSLEAHRGRGFVLEYTANYEEAITEFEAAIAINPNIADLHLALGRNEYYIQEYDSAITEFSRANALNPKDPDPETWIAKSYAINGDYQKAIQYAEAALVDDPLDPYLYGNLGLIYNSNKQYADAVDSLRIAVTGGTAADGSPVNGLPMDYGRIAQFYSIYGLALARTGQCGEALPLAQAISVGLRNDEVAVYNAQVTIETCEQLSRQGGVMPTSTLPSESTPTEAP
jgi:Flp pilus assembly protein TadD